MAHVESMFRQGSAAARRVAHDTSRSIWVRRLARLGFAARGALHITVGVLALMAALGLGGEVTGQKGALAHLASQPFGGVMLGLVALGLAGYSLWQFACAALGTAEPDGNSPLKRAGHAVVGVLHASLAVAAFNMLAGAGDNGRHQEREWTARLLAEPLGAVVVGAVGVAVIGVGLYQFYQAATVKFREKFAVYQMSPREAHATTLAGRVGYAARGVVFGLMGAFLIKAAAESDAGEVRGLDGALLELAQSDSGPFVLALVAAGFIAFGAFCLVMVRYRVLSRG
jgi:hypothetical protein